MPSNSAASVAVIHTWPRPSSRANSAARRAGSRWAATSSSSRIGGAAAPVGDQLGMGEDEAEQQRLLLAGRGARGGLVLGAMRRRRDPAGAGPTVARPAAASRPRLARSSRRGRRSFQPSSASAARGNRRPALRPARPSSAATVRGAGVAERRAMLGHLRFERGQPVGVGTVAARRAACCGRASPLRSARRGGRGRARARAPAGRGSGGGRRRCPVNSRSIAGVSHRTASHSRQAN